MTDKCEICLVNDARWMLLTAGEYSSAQPTKVCDSCDQELVKKVGDLPDAPSIEA